MLPSPLPDSIIKYHFKTMPTIFQRFAGGSTSRSTTAPITSGSPSTFVPPTPGASTTAEQSGIDPDASTGEQLTGGVGREDEGSEIDVDKRMRLFDIANEKMQKDSVPLNYLKTQTIRLEQDNTILKFVRRERPQRMGPVWSNKACKDVEKAAKSRCDFTKSELSLTVAKAKRFYTPQQIKDTISHARMSARSAKGQADMARNVYLMVEDLWKEHKSERSVEATSAKSRSSRKWKSFGKD
jgi:hypothetical protein